MKPIINHNILTIDQAIQAINNHQVVAIPTETVYGLFGLANSPTAVKRVFEAKNRPADNPLICHFWSLEQMLEYVQVPSQSTIFLIQQLCPAPLTFVLNLKANSPLAPCSAGLNTICCRIPSHPIALEILKKINIPLFGPSANSSTRVSGVCVEMIAQDLGSKIAGIVDGGMPTIGLESTIINCLENNKIEILRSGIIGKKELKQALVNFPNIEIIENATTIHTTPGAKYRHYSPRTRVVLESNETKKLEPNQTYNHNSKSKLPCHSELVSESNPPNQTYIGLIEHQNQIHDNNFISFGSVTDLNQVASQLFLNLYQLDQKSLNEVILLQTTWDFLSTHQSSVAKAITNRISKVLGL